MEVELSESICDFGSDRRIHYTDKYLGLERNIAFELKNVLINHIEKKDYTDFFKLNIDF